MDRRNAPLRRNVDCTAPPHAMSPAKLSAKQRVTAGRIVGSMVIAVALLGVVTYLDEVQAARAALADYGTEQSMVARAAAGSIRASFESGAASADEELSRSVRTRLRAVEQPGNVVVLVRRPRIGGFLAMDGTTVSSPPLEARFASGRTDGTWVRLTHEEAVALGLPPRTAIAGLAEIDQGPLGRWGVAVVSTAKRERDREERGMWRVALGFVLASGIVVTFGSLALRKQRKELELEQRLAVAEAELARDERLVRADKLATLGAMAMGIAHQVATPLGVILARAQRLKGRASDDERAGKAAGVIEEQAQRINEIVHGFLGLARGATPPLEHADAAQIARGAVDLVEHRFQKAGVDVRCDVEEGMPRIACDSRLLEQAIVNLLLNGCDACRRRGHVTLHVRAAGGSVVFVVDDDGAGITAEAATRAAEPFFTTKPPGEGTGLGLAIAKEIVQHHRGTLTVQPLPGRGTRARVEVPAVGDPS